MHVWILLYYQNEYALNSCLFSIPEKWQNYIYPCFSNFKIAWCSSWGESQRRPHLHLQMVIITIPGTILSMYSFTGDWDLISLFDLNHVRSKFPYRFRALEIFCILFWIKLWNESLPFYNYFIFDTITETELNFFIFFFLLTLWIALGCKRFKVRFIILTKTLVF